MKNILSFLLFLFNHYRCQFTLELQTIRINAKQDLLLYSHKDANEDQQIRKLEIKDQMQNSQEQIDEYNEQQFKKIEENYYHHNQELQNYYNYQYIGIIKILQNNTIIPYRVIFDTGSTWLWLPSYDCQGCPGNGLQCQHYNSLPKQDVCIHFDELINITYSVGSLTGHQAQGNFSLYEEFQQMPFILVRNLQGMEGAFYEGIMGLGKESLVQWPVSFFLSKEEDKSFITFGGYNKEFLKDKQINYFGIEDQWKINIDKLEYKWDGNDNRYKELQIVIDSGSSLLMLPEHILSDLLKLLNCQVLNSLAIKCPCPTHEVTLFPTLEFHIGDKILTLEGQYYVQTHPESAACHLLISPFPSHQSSLIILGNPFMRKYYTIFDYNQQTIGVVESKNHTPNRKYQPILAYISLLSICLSLSYLIIKKINQMIDEYIKRVELGKLTKKTTYRLV